MAVRFFTRARKAAPAMPSADARLWSRSQVRRVRAAALLPNGAMRDDFLASVVARANATRPWLEHCESQGIALWLASLATALREAMLGRPLPQDAYVAETLRALRQMCPMPADAAKVDAEMRAIGPAGIEGAVRDFLTAILRKATHG